MKKQIKRILSYAIAGYVINFSTPYVSGIINLYKPANAFRIEESYKKEQRLPSDATILNYLNASNMIISKEKPVVTPDCDDFARDVFAVFMGLTKRYGRLDLETKVRLNLGMIKQGKRSEGHMWIQFKDKGVWKYYEPSIQASSLDDTSPVYPATIEYNLVETLPGSKIPVPDISLESFNPIKRGIVVEFIKAWKNKNDKKSYIKDLKRELFNEE